MDDSAFNGLLDAYEAASSPALAKVIVLELIRRNDSSRISDYLPSVQELSVEEQTSLGNMLLGAGQLETVVEYLDGEYPSVGIIVAKALLENGDTEAAKRFYLAAIDAAPDLIDGELGQRLGVSADVAQNVTRLRVVDKAEDPNVLNMDRYRGEVTTFDDVVGLEKIKSQIRKRIIMPFQKPSLFARFRKKVGGGVLLFGPPGCGKTLLARATAGECNASFFNIEISDVLDMYIGESERKLHAIFEKARSEAPSVLFFDEIEALAGKREHARNSSATNVISQLLTELDGFSQNNSNVLTLASTNVPWALDPAFLRPGRFDRMFFVPPPDRPARAAILEHHMRDRPSAGNIDFGLMAKKTSGYSGADLANLVEMAADEAIDASIAKGEDQPIGSAHFREAVDESRSTTIEWLTTARNYARYANDGGRYNDVIDFLKTHKK